MSRNHQSSSRSSAAAAAVSKVDSAAGASADDGPSIRPRVEQLNEFIVCGLCDGYLIDATTVAHCLHSCTPTLLLNSVHFSLKIRIWRHQFYSLSDLQSPHRINWLKVLRTDLNNPEIRYKKL